MSWALQDTYPTYPTYTTIPYHDMGPPDMGLTWGPPPYDLAEGGLVSLAEGGSFGSVATKWRSPA